MKLVVGLGNPGPDYEHTRHNVGFHIVERLALRCRMGDPERRYRGRFWRGGVAGEAVALLEPMTFMNASGESVVRAATDLKIGEDELLVIHDDVDFELGTVRLKQSGGPGGHKGIRSIIEHLGDERFARLRVGVGRPAPSGDVSEWVLSPFASSERDALDEMVEGATEAVMLWLSRGGTAAMNEINRGRPGRRDAPRVENE